MVIQGKGLVPQVYKYRRTQECNINLLLIQFLLETHIPPRQLECETEKCGRNKCAEMLALFNVSESQRVHVNSAAILSVLMAKQHLNKC
eukprot:1252091-Amphidinium_carterae.1